MDGDQAVGDVSGSSGGTALHTCGGRIHCAQSNVTTRIRALEDELGAPLFNRLAKRITLTDSGRRILPYVGNGAIAAQGQSSKREGN
jgi:hypothetical protein